jgi:hypothetical protein
MTIALRHGVAVPDGLIVAAANVSSLNYYRRMVARLRDSTSVPRADLFESLIEGWADLARELDAQLGPTRAEAAEGAKEELIELLNAPLSDALAEHWQDLGGALPPPVGPPPPLNSAEYGREAHRLLLTRRANGETDRWRLRRGATGSAVGVVAGDAGGSLNSGGIGHEWDTAD